MTVPTDTDGTAALPVASRGENFRLTVGYFLPNYLRGIFRSRPRLARLVARLDPGRRGLRLMRVMRRRHGRGPVVVRGTSGPTLLVLDAEDARQVLAGPVEVYAVDTWEKVSGFATVQPEALIASHGRQRTARRAFNDAVLDAGRPVHRLAGHFLRIAGEEARALLGPRAEAGLSAEPGPRPRGADGQAVFPGRGGGRRRGVLAPAGRAAGRGQLAGGPGAGGPGAPAGPGAR
ncbi:hypothetical protein GCM10020000_68530 [Streptomyces olivoverticillatus]